MAVLKIKNADGTWTHLSGAGQAGEPGAAGPPGEKGDPGSPGIYYGAVQPTDDSHPVWIDPTGEAGTLGNVIAVCGVSPDDTGNVILTADDVGAATKEYVDSKAGPQGEKGDPGSPGIYYGEVQPTDDSHPVWINPTGEAGALGNVLSVCGVSPDDTGNVILTATDIGALPSAGGDMTGPINMNGQSISGLNSPTEDTQAATKGYVDGRTAEDIGALPVLGGAGAHNAIYRDKNIQSKYDDGSLWTAISSGTFEDLYIGDYFDITISTSFTASETVRCLLAGFDVYYKCGDTPLNTHHAVIVPMNCFAATAQMNSTNVTTGAYYGSAMHKNVLPVYSAAIKNVLGNHLLTNREMLTNAVSTSVSSMAGAGITGASSGFSNYDCTLRLMSEPEVYGTTALSSSFYDVGIAKTQLPLFRLRPDKIICGIGGSGYASETARRSWWLCAVAGSNVFSNVGGSGNVGNSLASDSGGVRPRWLIG